MQRLLPVSPCSFLVGMTKFLEPNYTKGIVLSLPEVIKKNWTFQARASLLEK